MANNNLPVDSSGSTSGLNQNQNQVPNQTPKPASGSLSKEQLETGPTPDFSERVPIVEQKEHEVIPEEVEGWLEKLERGEDVKLPQPITDDQDQPLVEPSGTHIEEENIILPTTETSLNQGLKAKVTSSARWLAEWALRLIKKFPGRVFYKN
jgi:hypothetical protein